MAVLNMPPKPGNAFAQQKATEHLEQRVVSPGEASSVVSIEQPGMNLPHDNSSNEETATDDNSAALFRSGQDHPSRPNIGARQTTATSPTEDVIKTTTLHVPATQHDDPSTAGTTVSALLGPETEQEKRGRQMVREQREEMEAKLNRNRSHKSRQSTDSSRTAVKHRSAMPVPLFRGKFDKVKNIFKKSPSPAPAVPALDKPLPAIVGPEAAYAQAYGSYFPGAYVPSPVSVHGGPSVQTGSDLRQAYSQSYAKDLGQQHSQHAAAPLNSNVPTLYSSQDARSQLAYPEQGWPLPQPRTATGHLSTQTFETNPNQYLRTGNQGMIFANHSLTPTRAGDFATLGQPKVVHPPSMMSMAASIVDAQSPTAVKHSSNLGVVPEAQETKEMQAAAASDVEKLYNRGANDSHSENSPFRARQVAPADGTAVCAVIPRLPRARSLPNMHFTASSAAAPAESANKRAAKAASDRKKPATAGMLDELYRREREMFAELYHREREMYSELVRGIKHSRRAVQHDLVILHNQLKDLERNDTFAFLEQRMHTLDARTQRIEDKLDALTDALRSVGVGAGARAAAGGRRGMEERLGAPGPHVPWGSQSLNARDRDASAGIGGGLEGAQAWYRAQRRA